MGVEPPTCQTPCGICDEWFTNAMALICHHHKWHKVTKLLLQIISKRVTHLVVLETFSIGDLFSFQFMIYPMRVRVSFNKWKTYLKNNCYMLFYVSKVLPWLPIGFSRCHKLLSEGNAVEVKFFASVFRFTAQLSTIWTNVSSGKVWQKKEKKRWIKITIRPAQHTPPVSREYFFLSLKNKLLKTAVNRSNTKKN